MWSQATLKVIQAGSLIEAECECAELNFKAFVDVKRLAESGNLQAELKLFSFYTLGQECYRSDSLAAVWLEKAASRFAPAAVSMAAAYVTGEGVDVDFEKSLAMVKHAAQLDSRYAPLPELWRSYFDETRQHMKKLGIDIDDEKLNRTRFGCQLFPDGTFQPNEPPSDWKIDSRKCSVCASATKSLCEQCRQVRYCSRVCQKQDWPHHKPICLQVKNQKEKK